MRGGVGDSGRDLGRAWDSGLGFSHMASFGRERCLLSDCSGVLIPSLRRSAQAQGFAQDLAWVQSCHSASVQSPEPSLLLSHCPATSLAGFQLLLCFKTFLLFALAFAALCASVSLSVFFASLDLSVSQPGVTTPPGLLEILPFPLRGVAMGVGEWLGTLSTFKL